MKKTPAKKKPTRKYVRYVTVSILRGPNGVALRINDKCVLGVPDVIGEHETSWTLPEYELTRRIAAALKV